MKQWIKARWPRLRLRTILFATLFLVAALPGIGAVWLRVYENTLVRQTESELIAQGTALAAAAAALWPGAPPLSPPGPTDFAPEPPGIDLSATPILPERPAPEGGGTPSPASLAAAVRLAPVIATTRRTTLAAILLLDGAGRIVTEPNAGRSYAALPEVHAALAGRADTTIRRNGAYRAIYSFEWLSRAAAIRVHHARPIVVEGKVVGVLLLSRSSRALFRGMYEDRGKIAIGVLVIFGLLVVLTAILSRGIARPIEALGSATKAVAAGRGTVPPVPQTAAIEIQDLYRDFAAMAEAIERRSRYLRDFAHAVSHEFKTPLTGIRGALELLHDHDASMSSEDRRRFLANADADVGRLNLLLTRLLDLARADMTPGDTGATADVAATAARVADALRRDGFVVTTEIDPALPEAALPEDSLETALVTLIDNSRQSGAAHAKIAATIAEGRIRVRVSDDGPGIPPADRERVFEPFFTSRRAEGGTGLGLPILRSLMETAGASVVLVPGDVGATFVLDLPVAR